MTQPKATICRQRAGQRFRRLALGRHAPLLPLAAVLLLVGPTAAQQPADVALASLPGTELLTTTGDLNDRILSGASRFLDQQLATARDARRQHFVEILRSPAADRPQQLAPLRQRLQTIIGGNDPRAQNIALQTVAPLGGSAALAEIDGLAEIDDLVVQQVRWQVLEGYDAEGIAVLPAGEPPRATIILLPDAGTDPAVLAGLVDSQDGSAGAALQLAAAGCQVIIPRPISRQAEKRLGRAELTDREYVYRATYVLGRHPLGLEVQAVRALADALGSQPTQQPETTQPSASVQLSAAESPPAMRPLAVAGYGEGGLVALLAAAIDNRFDAVLASGCWGNRDAMWREPLSRNVFGMLQHFGDAELACLIAPRPLIIEAAGGPQLRIDAPSAAPGELTTPTPEQFDQAAQRVSALMSGDAAWLQIIQPPQSDCLSAAACSALLAAMLHSPAAPLPDRNALRQAAQDAVRRLPDGDAARQRQLRQIEALGRRWVVAGRKQRDAMIAALDTSSLEAYQRSTAPLRQRLEQEVLGKFDQPLVPPAVRSRLWQQTADWIGWEVEMDVFPEVIAGGILLMPQSLMRQDAGAGQPRPVVVCVHGLEGRPTDTIIGDHRAYHDYAARLCQRGFIVFCPQQLYRGGDAFRVLQRKANPLGKTLFSILIPQHRQIVRWLQTLPQVDPQRIGFYGLSYGGKSAMRIPSVVTEYGPTICSADFNEWVLKNVSTDDRFSYVATGEYEIFEFDLAGTFSYGEMAALICPRPFMVERGHFDGVGEDRWVAFEYAPVRHLYAARLGLPERTEIEWFVGPHTINGQATFDFLHRHLQWPRTE